MFARASKIPLQSARCARRFLQFAEHVFRSVVPEHALTEDEAERHLVNQRFEGCRLRAVASKKGMRPFPEIAMAIAAVVSLNAVAQRLAVEFPSIEDDAAGENRVRMRSTGEANPAC